VGALVLIWKGRKLMEKEIFAAAAEKVRVFGIELLDIRFNRIDYNDKECRYDRLSDALSIAKSEAKRIQEGGESTTPA